MLATNAPYSDSYPLAILFGGLFRQKIDASVLLCATSCLTPALLPAGDEFAMNFVPFRALFLPNFGELRKRKFREIPKGEVRRIPIPRTRVNKG
jgi:hypothetical protein